MGRNIATTQDRIISSRATTRASRRWFATADMHADRRERVFVYWNLHKACWSVRALTGAHRGRVIMHADQITLSEVTGRVSAAGRARVIREGRKNVHAGLVGTLRSSRVIGSGMPKFTDTVAGRGITYNPRRAGTFTYLDTGAAYEGSTWATLVVDGSRPVVAVK